MKDLPRTPYHIGDQQSDALLAPIRSTLRELEGRLGHYVERLRMPDADREAILRAQSVLRQACQELES